MHIDIAKKKENKALNRTEVAFKISECKVTPKRLDVRAKLAALMGSKEQLAIVDSLHQQFGSDIVTGTAKVYNDEATLRKLEPSYLIARNEGRKEKKEKAVEKPQEKKEKTEKKPEEKSAGAKEKAEKPPEKPAAKEAEKEAAKEAAKA